MKVSPENEKNISDQCHEILGFFLVVFVELGLGKSQAYIGHIGGVIIIGVIISVGIGVHVFFGGNDGGWIWLGGNRFPAAVGVWFQWCVVGFVIHARICERKRFFNVDQVENLSEREKKDCSFKFLLLLKKRLDRSYTHP